jgi:hypothetical protein
MRGPKMRMVLIAFGLALVLTGCGDDPEPRRASSPSATMPSPSSSSPSSPAAAYEERWIAVIDVAADPNDLDALTQRMLDPLGAALMVAPTQCFEGLPDAAGNGYVIGAMGDSRREVERRVLEAGEEVAFTANVKIFCTD